MALDNTVYSRQVVGQYLTPDKRPAKGYIDFYPSMAPRRAGDDTVVTAPPVRAFLRADGSFEVELLCSTNPSDENMWSNDWHWRVAHKVEGLDWPVYSLVLPYGNEINGTPVRIPDALTDLPVGEPLPQLALAALSDVDPAGAVDNDVLGYSGGMWRPIGAPAASVTWGAITGTLSDQTDLQSALDAAITDSDMPMHLHNQTSPNVDPSSSTKTAALAALASYPEDGIHVFTDNVIMRSGDRLWMYNPWAVTLWNFGNHEGLSMSATGAYYYRSGDGEEVPTQVTTFETAGVTIGNRSTANPTLTTVAGDWTAQPIQQWERGAANGGTVVAQIESDGAVTQTNTLTTKEYVDGRMWFGTQAAYDLLTPDADVLYVITG